MITENDKKTTQNTQKEEWKQPEITKLDINETKGGDTDGLTEDGTYNNS